MDIEKKNIGARLSLRQIEKLEEIMAEVGVTSYSAGVAHSIEKAYDKFFPASYRKKLLKDSNK